MKLDGPVLGMLRAAGVASDALEVSALEVDARCDEVAGADRVSGAQNEMRSSNWSTLRAPSRIFWSSSCMSASIAKSSAMLPRTAGSEYAMDLPWAESWLVG